jgi:hypothetical protein
MQRACNVPPIEGWVIAVLYVFGIFLVITLIAIPAFVQSGLNKVWRLYPPAEGNQVEIADAPAPPQANVPDAPPPQAADRLDK